MLRPGELDANGNTITPSEDSFAMEDSDGDEQSPAAARIDPQKRQGSDRKPPLSSVGQKGLSPPMSATLGQSAGTKKPTSG